MRGAPTSRSTEYEGRRACDVLRPLIDLAIALEDQSDLSVVLERIVAEVRRLTNAEAGTLFLREGPALRFAARRRPRLPVQCGGRRAERLSTRSPLVVPLHDISRDVIGVLPLIDARDANSHVASCDPRCEWLILIENSRNFSIVTRHGGDEFAVLLINTPTSGAPRYADRIKRLVERHTVRDVRVTARIGVASMPDDVTASDDLMPVADRALYAAEHLGRNTSQSPERRAGGRRAHILPGMALPEGFPTLSLPVRPPYPRMEALAVGELPVGEGWLYESQWAGFRCLAFREGGQVVLQSKSAQPLTPYVPELVAALSARRAERFAVDGEIVVATYGRLDFDALLQRIHPAESRVRRFARETPVTYLLFDALVDDQGQDLTALPLAGRRQRLQALVERWPADERFRLSPAAPDRGRAARWLAELGGAGLDSVVAKRADAAYAAGDRTAMRKVKRAPMADRVVVGFRYAQTGGEVGSRLLGLYDDEGLLHHIGFSASFSVPERRRLKPLVEPLVQAPGFTGSAPGGPGRWRARRNTEWQPLEPRLVCEVRYDHFSGRRFRHGAKFLRWRPDKAPRLCTFAQVAGGPDRGLEEFWSRQRTG